MNVATPSDRFERGVGHLLRDLLIVSVLLGRDTGRDRPDRPAHGIGRWR